MEEAIKKNQKIKCKSHVSNDMLQGQKGDSLELANRKSTRNKSFRAQADLKPEGRRKRSLMAKSLGRFRRRLSKYLCSDSVLSL